LAPFLTPTSSTRAGCRGPLQKSSALVPWLTPSWAEPCSERLGGQLGASCRELPMLRGGQPRARGLAQGLTLGLEALTEKLSGLPLRLSISQLPQGRNQTFGSYCTLQGMSMDSGLIFTAMSREDCSSVLPVGAPGLIKQQR